MVKGETLQKIWHNLSDDRKRKINTRAKKLEEEYLTLQDLRKDLNFTQENMAKKLHIKQENISRLERRSDMLFSTLRNYIQAMGGDLKIVTKFPNRAPVVLEGLGDLINKK